MPYKRARRAQRLFTFALVLSTLGLYAATGMLYVTQSAQRQLLAKSVRTSGWVAYQAQLEYVKSIAALDIARESLSHANIDNLALRLKSLSSRLPILYGSKEGRIFSGMEDYVPALKRGETRINSYLDQLSRIRPGDPQAVALLARWRFELAPLGADLEEILGPSVIYNDDIYRQRASARAKSCDDSARAHVRLRRRAGCAPRHPGGTGSAATGRCAHRAARPGRDRVQFPRRD